MTFGDHLDNQLTAQGLTVYALAKRTGLTQRALHNLVSGRSEPSWRTVQLLALALGCSTERLRDSDLELSPVANSAPRGRPKKSPEK